MKKETKQMESKMLITSLAQVLNEVYGKTVAPI
jgi:hypothetical protein